MRDDHRHEIGQDRLQALMGQLTERLKPPASGLRSSPLPDRLDSARSATRVLIPIAIIAALVAGGYLWLARPRPEPAARSAASASLADPRPASPVAASSSTVVVHVLGKVRRPGVITLPAGSRVAEAIKAAGGVRPGAGTGPLNLARKVVDGEQIPIGVQPLPNTPATPSPPQGSSTPGSPLDLNTATAEQLDQLPGVGPVLAQRIVEYRTQHGAFRTVDQLQEVTGIGARRYAELRPMVRT